MTPNVSKYGTMRKPLDTPYGLCVSPITKIIYLTNSTFQVVELLYEPEGKTGFRVGERIYTSLQEVTIPIKSREDAMIEATIYML